MQTALPELPPGPDLENLRGPVEAASGSPWPLIITLLILLTLAGGLLCHGLARRRQSKAKAHLSPCQAAQRILQHAHHTKDDAELSAQASLAVRTALGSILPSAIAATTAEISGRLQSVAGIESYRIHQFLQACDSVKFSGQPLPEKQRIQILETAGSIIDELQTVASKPEKKTART